MDWRQAASLLLLPTKLLVLDPHLPAQRRERETKQTSLVFLAINTVCGRHSNQALTCRPSVSVSGIQQGSPNHTGPKVRVTSAQLLPASVWSFLWSLAVWCLSSRKHPSWIEHRHKGLWPGSLLKFAIDSQQNYAFKGFVIKLE